MKKRDIVEDSQGNLFEVLKTPQLGDTTVEIQSVITKEVFIGERKELTVKLGMSPR